MRSLVAVGAAVVAGAVLALPVMAASGTGVRPDDRAGIRGPGASAFVASRLDLGHLRPDDRSGIRGPGTVQPPVLAPVTTTPSFEWGDAAIGAGAGAGIVVLLLGATVLVRHARTEPRPA